MIEIVDLSQVKFIAFDWNEGNRNKNWLRHKVTNEESEQIFYNQPLVVFEDLKHSQKEKRLVAYGVTDRRRKLAVVFTIRGDKIRIVSARDQNKKERRIYEKNKKYSAI
jgi:uncharacterized DUF497 family protein